MLHSGRQKKNLLDAFFCFRIFYNIIVFGFQQSTFVQEENSTELVFICLHMSGMPGHPEVKVCLNMR